MLRCISIFVLLLGLSLQLSAADNPKRVPSGLWGGHHLSLTVNDAGAELEFDCATGSISAPLVLNRKGEFRVEGTYRHQSPAQTRADDSGRIDSGVEVTYVGKLNGDSLRIEVTLPGLEKPTVFYLIRDHDGALTRCA